MKIELNEQDAKLIVEVFKKVDPLGFFTNDLARRIFEQVKVIYQSQTKDDVTFIEKKPAPNYAKTI